MINSFLEIFANISKLHPNEIPSYTQIYFNGKCIAESFNKVEEKLHTSLHSEILCIELAQINLQTKFLKDCVLLTAIEPCLMCTGSIINARIAEVIYFINATKTEGISSLNIESIYTKNHFPKLTLHHSNEIQTILKNFFKDKRY